MNGVSIPLRSDFNKSHNSIISSLAFVSIPLRSDFNEPHTGHVLFTKQVSIPLRSDFNLYFVKGGVKMPRCFNPSKV